MTKNTGLDFIPANKSKALKAKKEIELIEKENKLKLKFNLLPSVPTKSPLKLSEAFSKYLETIRKDVDGKRDNHSRTSEVVFKRFMGFLNNDLLVTEVSSHEIQKFVRMLRNELSNSSVLTYIRYLKGFFNYLVEEEVLQKSPIAKRHSPKAETNEIKVFRSDHIVLILNKAQCVNNEYYKIFKFLLITGIRPCDIFGLKAGNFDLDQKTLSFTMSKTKQAIAFPLYMDLLEFIQTEIPGLKTLSKDELIFKKYGVERIGKVFRWILTTLELKNEGYNLKTFRKTFASQLAANGIGLGDLADLLGHTSTNTTRQFYKKKNAVAIGKRIDDMGGLKIC